MRFVHSRKAITNMEIEGRSGFGPFPCNAQGSFRFRRSRHDVAILLLAPGSVDANAGDDVICGSSGDEGDDMIDGGAGMNVLDGGEGFDIYDGGSTFESCEVAD